MDDFPIYWYLPPIVLATGLVYGATRHERWGNIVAHSYQAIKYVMSFILLTSAMLYLVIIDLSPAMVIGILLSAYLLSSWWERRKRRLSQLLQQANVVNSV